MASDPGDRVRDWLAVAAAFTGARVGLVLRDETGTWYRDGSGLSRDQLERLDSAWPQGGHLEPQPGLAGPQELRLIEAMTLPDEGSRHAGTLCVLASDPLVLSEGHRNGLKAVAERIQALVPGLRPPAEAPDSPSPEAEGSFIAGLVHELGSFTFGISASLDAFEARFEGREEMQKHGANLRRSLDRLSAFNLELREYAHPPCLSRSSVELEALLKEAVDHHLELAARRNIDLQLRIEESLPPIHADRPCLLAAFIRVIELVLQHEESGGCVTLGVATTRPTNQLVIAGSVDFSSRKFEKLDLDRLFDPFYFRASGPGRLILPVARRVFESHGGTLAAEPGPPGGMRIRFMLPAELTYPSQAAGQP